MVSTIAATLGVRETAGRGVRDSLITYLADKHLLLVLDNYEHLLPAAPVVADLLAAAPDVQVLATSRAPLQLRAEREYPVAPLRLPPHDARGSFDELAAAPAIALFVERARAVRPAFALTPDTVRTVAAICRRLDGLPLAIELAAARVRVFSPAALLARLERTLPVLADGARDLPARHQTLRATIAWSEALLTADEQTLFRRLAVFTGGWTFAAAEAVANPDGTLDVLTALSSLVTKSLVRQAALDEGEPRFGMLETIREFAQERLAERAEERVLHDRHLAYFAALIAPMPPSWMGPGAADWYAEHGADYPNLRAALDYALARQRSEEALILVTRLDWHWTVNGLFSEGLEWLERTLEATKDTPSPAHVDAVLRAGDAAMQRDDLDRATDRLAHARRLAHALGYTRGIAHALWSQAYVAQARSDPDTAHANLTQSLMLFRAIDHPWAIAQTQAALADMALDRGDVLTAGPLLDEAMTVFRRLDDPWTVAFTLVSQAQVALHEGELARAATLLDEGLTGLRALGSKADIAMTLQWQAIVAREAGDPRRAATVLAESRALLQELGSPVSLAWSSVWSGVLAWDAGDPEDAERRCRESLAVFRSHDLQTDSAVVMRTLCQIAVEQGRLQEACAWIRAALPRFQAAKHGIGMAQGLETAAHLLASTHHPRDAGWCLGAAHRMREQLGARVLPTDRVRQEALIATLRDVLGEHGFPQACEEGQVAPPESVAAHVLEVANHLLATAASATCRPGSRS
jgi:predicted ATPase